MSTHLVGASAAEGQPEEEGLSERQTGPRAPESDLFFLLYRAAIKKAPDRRNDQGQAEEGARIDLAVRPGLRKSPDV